MMPATMPTLSELRQLLNVVDARLNLIGDRDPAKRTELETRRADLQQQILERGGEAPRLPYGDPE